MDLLHVLFGTVLGLDDDALLLVTGTASVTLLAVAAIYRLLVAECLDPGFLRASGGAGGWVHMGFLVLVVVNLVAGFQVLGTLMVVGMMMLPAASARFWALSAARQIPLAAGLGVLVRGRPAGFLSLQCARLARHHPGRGRLLPLSIVGGPRGGCCGRAVLPAAPDSSGDRHERFHLARAGALLPPPACACPPP